MLGDKSMPCDDTPVYYKINPNGKDKIVTPNGIVITCDIIGNPNKADGVRLQIAFYDLCKGR